MCKSSASNQRRLEGRNGKKMIKTIPFFLNNKKKKALGKSRVGSWHVNRVCKWS